jgi:hypothetical protein
MDGAERKQSNRSRTYFDGGSDPLSGQLTYSWLVPAVGVGCIPNAQVRLSHQASQEVMRNSRSNRATIFHQAGISSPCLYYSRSRNLSCRISSASGAERGTDGLEAEEFLGGRVGLIRKTSQRGIPVRLSPHQLFHHPCFNPCPSLYLQRDIVLKRHRVRRTRLPPITAMLGGFTPSAGPADSAPLCPRVSARACKSSSGTRPGDRGAPARFEYRSRLPASESQRHAERHAALPAWPGRLAAPPLGPPSGVRSASGSGLVGSQTVVNAVPSRASPNGKRSSRASTCGR